MKSSLHGRRAAAPDKCSASSVILEPVGRNTAPAVAISALQAMKGAEILSYWCYLLIMSSKIPQHFIVP